MTKKVERNLIINEEKPLDLYANFADDLERLKTILFKSLSNWKTFLLNWVNARCARLGLATP